MTLCFCSCDDGRIYREEMEVRRDGRVLKLTDRFSSVSNWIDDYGVAVADFSDKSEYAVITKSLSVNVVGGIGIVMMLGSISNEVRSLKLCVISRLHECTVEFKAMGDEELITAIDTILMDMGTSDVGMSSFIQSQVFNKRCVAYHERTGSASGSLSLTRGKSYHMLVNQPAHKDSDILLVKSDSAEENFLHLVLNRTGDVSMDHTDMLSEDEQPLLRLINNRVNEGIFLSNERTMLEMNNKKQPINQSESTLTEIFKYEAKEGVSELHVMIHSVRPGDTYEGRLNTATNACNDLLAGRLKGVMAAFRRYFLGDTANQADLLLAITTESSDCAPSVVGQPPLDGTKIALWAYLQTNVQTQVLRNGLLEVKHNTCHHLWGGSVPNRAINSEYQTRLLLNGYAVQLTEQKCKLADNCIRIQFFVQNVGVDRAGAVKAYNGVFVTQNLTEKIYYIVNTGIGGRHADPKALVQVDTYAVAGLKPEQIHFLYAPTHLNPTYEYDVSLGRGTYVDYGDRRQVFVSGTASINNKGEVVYPGDICRQTGRM